jgi:YD repeat-containing protein
MQNTLNSLLETVTGPDGVTRYAYDGMDGLVSVTLPGGNTISYTYDLPGRLTSVSTKHKLPVSNCQ